MSRREKGTRPEFLRPDNSYELLVPVSYSEGGEAKSLSVVQLRRLTATEMLIMDEPIGWTAQLLKMLESMTGLMRVVTCKIDAVDMDRIDDIFGYFMEPGSVTGAIS